MEQDHRDNSAREDRQEPEASERTSGEGSASALERLRELERSKANATPRHEKPRG